MTTRDLLRQLLTLIEEERTCAINLDSQGLLKAAKAKEDLLISLKGLAKLDTEEERQLARRIREENRHNAFLLKSALDWIRENMAFFGQKAAPESYGAGGAYIAGGGAAGQLLSGHI